MVENSEAIPHSLAMFASNTKNNGGNSQTHGSNGRGRGINGYDWEEVEEGIVITMVVIHRITLLTGTTLLIKINPTQLGNQSYKTDSNRPIYQICGKSGHQALDCYHRMDFAYQGKNPPTKLAVMAIASNAAITSNQDPWLADSGTSDHLTASLSNLTTQSQLEMANPSLSAI